MEILIGIGIFFTTVLLIEGGYIALQGIHKPELKRIRKRLRIHNAEAYEKETVDIVRRRTLSSVPWLDHLLSRMHHVHSVYRLMEQANVRSPFGVFILLSLLLATAGIYCSITILRNYLIAVPLAGILGSIPFLYLYVKKNRRIKKFEWQFPGALDLIARALRAGHAFSAGLKMAAEEFDDPLGTEFGRALEMVNLGVGVTDALKSILKRVDYPDLKFFVVAVIIQRETGGNLAEILENLGSLIRKRFELRGRIRALSAEGKFSAIVLVAIPFAIGFVLSITNPKYIGILLTDPIGKILVALALLFMIMGVLVMKKMINIKV